MRYPVVLHINASDLSVCKYFLLFFSSRRLILLDISISCQDMFKKRHSKVGLVFLKIVSEQSRSFKRINSEYLLFWEVSFIAFFGKNTKAQGNFSR